MLAHQIEHLDGLGEEAEHIAARNAGLALAKPFREHVVKAFVGQFGDDYQLLADAFHAVRRQKEGMTQILDAQDGLQLFVGLGAVSLNALEIAVDELDLLEKAAGNFAFPNFAEAPATEGSDQTVAWNGLSVGLLGE